MIFVLLSFFTSIYPFILHVATSIDFVFWIFPNFSYPV
ncbi:hypothetical protein EfmE1636_1696 [Enterococcus faecium E1636]|nr:hypothetical protein EfmE1636_1696 [Enterococcus faecium E1636]